MHNSSLGGACARTSSSIYVVVYTTSARVSVHRDFYLAQILSCFICIARTARVYGMALYALLRPLDANVFTKQSMNTCYHTLTNIE